MKGKTGKVKVEEYRDGVKISGGGGGKNEGDGQPKTKKKKAVSFGI